MKKALVLFFCLFIMFSAVSAAYSGSSSVQQSSEDFNVSEVQQSVESAGGFVDKVMDVVGSTLNDLFG